MLVSADLPGMRAGGINGGDPAGTQKTPVLVSACLLGAPCRYDGKCAPCAAVVALAANRTLIPVCPEALGGLPTPRPPAEIRGDRVVTKGGADVTDAYRAGARAAVEIARASGARTAIFKTRSPSCGLGQVYDGSFSGTLTDGSGIAAEALTAAGVRVVGEDAVMGGQMI